MKFYCLLIALLIPVLNSFAEIKNGYAHGISAAYQSLQAFKDLLQHDGSLTPVKKKVIEERLRNVITYIAYYELTGELLKQFKGMSPELYHEIITLKTRKGALPMFM